MINVAGHRLGTKELESAALTVPEIAEAAAVPVIDDIRGRIVEMYVSLKPGIAPDGMEAKVSKAIEVEIGKIARPKNVWVVADMPKTRSGKIMRRVIASVSNFTDVGDVTTLANPEVVETIRHHVQSIKVGKGELPRQLSEAEYEEIAKYGAAEYREAGDEPRAAGPCRGRGCLGTAPGLAGAGGSPQRGLLRGVIAAGRGRDRRVRRGGRLGRHARDDGRRRGLAAADASIAARRTAGAGAVAGARSPGVRGRSFWRSMARPR